jgi:hypothetical protein
MSRRWIMVTSAAALLATALEGQTPFQLPRIGCPMAHCDPRMSGYLNTAIPAGPAVEALSEDVAAGSGAGSGLGCSANGTVVACAYRRKVVVYDANGARRFDSGGLLGDWTMTSAPVVAVDGSVIAADATRIVRFEPDGTVLWDRPLAGGLPISPVPMANGTLFVATYGGPLSIHSIADGSLLGKMFITSPDGTLTYETLNTPTVKGSRAYVLMSARADPWNRAQLVAIDVDPANTAAPLRIAWTFPFAGPSGGSPLMLADSNMVVFDADRLDVGGPLAPQLAAVRDDGATPTLVWRMALRGTVRASVARDPRGGIWFFTTAGSFLYRLAGQTGQALQKIDLDVLINDEGLHVPSSVMTLAPKTATHNTAMIVGAAVGTPPGASYVAAIDLEQSTLLWKVRVGASFAEDFVASQFAIVNHGAKPRVVFPTTLRGAIFVGER